MSRTRTYRLFAVVTALALTGALAAPTFATQSAGKAQTVKVTLTEFAIKFSPKKVKAGSVTFKVTNKGNVPHNFEIAGKKTALLKKGGTAKLTVELKKGTYDYECDVKGHPEAGMEGQLRVS